MTRKERIERDGYIIVRDLLSAEDVRRLRSALLRHFEKSWRSEGLGKHQPHAAWEIPAISWLLAHEKIAGVMRELLGSEQIVFTGNCDAHQNMLSWWHKDTGEADGGCFAGDYFDRPGCQVYRAGIYLQDQPVNGLSVRRGSHRTRSTRHGQEERLVTSAGDVIFFDIRLTHAGQFADLAENVLLQLGRRFRREHAAARIKDAYQRIMRKPAKLSLFFSYGREDADTRAYCRFEWAAKRATIHGTTLPSHLSQALADAGIRGPLS